MLYRVCVHHLRYLRSLDNKGIFVESVTQNLGCTDRLKYEYGALKFSLKYMFQ